MFGIIRRIIGKVCYLKRKIEIYKWSKPNEQFSLNPEFILNYVEYNEFSEVRNLNFVFDEAEYKKRFSLSHVFCGLFDNKNRLCAYGWINDSGKHFLGELDLRMDIPKNNSMLYDFFTYEEYRGKGLYPFLLSQICNRDHKSKLIYVLPRNESSIKGIIKANFYKIGLISGLTKRSYKRIIQK